MSEKEPVYTFLTWLIGQYSSSQTFYLCFWALFPCVALYYTFRDELSTSTDYLIAYLCFFGLGLYAFFVAGIRQTAAMSLVLLSYQSFKHLNISLKIKDYWNFDALKVIIYLLIAYNIHNSVLLFIPILFFMKLKIRWWYIVVAVGLCFISSFIKIDVIVNIALMFFGDRFDAYGVTYESSQSIYTFLIQLILFIICFIQKDKLCTENRTNTYLFNIVMAGLLFQSLSGLLYEMARVSFYFSIFFLILVPRAIKAYPTEFKMPMYWSFGIAFLVYLFFLSESSLPEYSSAII